MSRKWINVTAKKIEELQKDPSKSWTSELYLLMERFSNYGVIIRIGRVFKWKKYVLGIYRI
ncbi:MAG: hypothetical protein IPJ71_18780 [Bdellovibrionales bacterium]|nr:hypothetical protein [Bdellovibrionales bacterium]